MSLENTLQELTSELREYVQANDIASILIPLLSIKYINDFEEIDEQASLPYILKQATNIEDTLLNAFQIIERHKKTLHGAYKIYPQNIMQPTQLFSFLAKLQTLQYTREDWQKALGTFIEQTQHVNYSQWNTTPRIVNKLGVRILAPEKGTFYDGTAGIAGTLIEAADYADEGLQLFGQELNEKTYAYAKFNMLFQQVNSYNLALGNTLTAPAFIKNGQIKKFDYVLMNFPFSTQLDADELVEDDPYNRFIFGIPSRRSADYSFIMHGISSLKEAGRAVFVVSNGALFRGGGEQRIRENLLAADLIEAVIALPENLFSYTTIQTNLLVVNKQKSDALKGKVLFINAEDMYEKKIRNVRTMSDAQIEQIVDIYNNKTEVEDTSEIVSITEIENANLLCKQYIGDAEVEGTIFGTVKIAQDKVNVKNKMIPLKNMTESIYRGINLSTKTIEEGKGDYKIIKLSDVQDGEINIETLTDATLLRQSRINRYLVQRGDVIVSNRGAQIKIAVVPEVGDNILLTHNFLGIRCQNDLDPAYLKAFLESPVGHYLLTRQQVGTVVLTINPKNLEEVPIYVPEKLEEQRKMAQQLNQAEQQYRQAVYDAEQKLKNTYLDVYNNIGLTNFMNINERGK